MKTQLFRFAFFLLIYASIPLTAGAQVVAIPDPNLRAVLETALGKASGDPIIVAEMATLTHLEGDEANINGLTGLEFATNLTWLNLGDNSIRDISAVAGLTNLTVIYLWNNALSDLSPLTGLINLIELDLHENSISDLSPLSGLTNLKWLWLEDNSISDISTLVTNAGLGDDDIVGLRRNTLNYPSINTYIPALQVRGVSVRVDHRTVTTILKISGDQRGFPSSTLPNPFVAEVRDEYGAAYEGVPVTFAITAGSGTLSVTHATTDRNGRAQSTLTLGPDLGIRTVSATAAGWVIDDPVFFSVISDTKPPPVTTDVNGDGTVNILDLVLVASAFGSEGPDLRTDVNADDVVDTLDLVWVADAFGAAANAP